MAFHTRPLYFEPTFAKSLFNWDGYSVCHPRNRSAENSLHAHRPYVGTELTDRHRHERLQWADRHINWTRQDWRTVLFSDESRFALSNSDGRIRVYRCRVNVTRTVVFSSGTVLAVGVP